MPAILKTLLKAIITLVIFVYFQVSVFAQCATQISKKGQPLKMESTENYQYLRLGKQYFGISFKIVMVKKANGNKFHVSIKYTSPLTTFRSGRMVFKLANDTEVSVKLKFINVQKTDDKKSNNDNYEIDLSDANVADLQHNGLKELAISIKGNSCVIPVNNPKFIQEQISCLQSN
ncbi:MAG: hypothetical protein H7289_05990 [Mucilaginibacter sp.]|nr:hypothetical protein [Mucilaginibacter sp.]